MLRRLLDAVASGEMGAASPQERALLPLIEGAAEAFEALASSRSR